MSDATAKGGGRVPPPGPCDGAYSRVTFEWEGAAEPAQVQRVHTDTFKGPDAGPRNYWAVARPDKDALWFESEAAAKAWIETNLPGGKWRWKGR